MSMSNPNEHEILIENYAEACRTKRRCAATLEAAQKDYEDAVILQQGTWRPIRTLVAEGKIKQGIYRIDSGADQHAEALNITGGDYPELLPMYRER